ncbi:MAG: toll/interleukin-1 receptor domain-containing protein [Anaeroplasmataceae bacterium]|nr:toll/interleukin-1 receptor domain-containing protein [Anaeroplasmataceae bacterium]
MKNIFISYKVHNRKQAISYFTYLQNKGYQVWFDQLILKNHSWQDEIKEHIKNCDIVLCLLSEACLLDDWVLHQVRMAKAYHKKLMFIFLDDTPLNKFKKYKIKQRDIYQDIPSFSIEKEEFYSLRKNVQKGMNFPLFILGIMMFITIYIACYGCKIGNLFINQDYGWICLGLSFLMLLTYIPNRFVFYINSILSILLLGISYFVIAPYYVSDILINPIIYLMFFTFPMLFRFSKSKFLINLLFSFFYTILNVLLNFVVVVFFQQLFDVDLSILSVLLLFIVLLINYYGSKDYYNALEEYKVYKKNLFH